MIEKYVIDRLEATPIEGVAERLGLRVEHHKSLCPFHDDSRPSLTFNTYRNRYRCYVCDAHGGVIDLVKGVKGVGFKEACNWLDSGITEQLLPPSIHQSAAIKIKKEYPPDIAWLSQLVSVKYLNPSAQRFLFEERHIDPRVAAWCGLTSIASPAPCWRYGKPFYDAPSLLIPYYDVDGRLMSVQSRYLGTPETSEPKARFKFPRGAVCHIYNLPILRTLQPGEELWITEGCSDCWAMLSSGRKAIAIPSATLLKEKDLKPLETCRLELGTTFHMYPDQDRPGEKLFLELREKLSPYTGGVGEGLQRHQLPEGCKDFGAWYAQSQINIHPTGLPINN